MSSTLRARKENREYEHIWLLAFGGCEPPPQEEGAGSHPSILMSNAKNNCKNHQMQSAHEHEIISQTELHCILFPLSK
jgi:hypothetical protein